MPFTPIDYSKCIIYKIVCLDDKVDEIYVGHTTDFKTRKSGHKTKCVNGNKKLYQFIRANGGWFNFNMIPVEEYPCENRTQARIREEQVRLELQAQLNMCKAYISEEDRKKRDIELCKQWYEEHKEQLKEHNKQYRDEHKEQIAERAKQQYTCECGSVSTKQHKKRHEQSKKHQKFINSQA